MGSTQDLKTDFPLKFKQVYNKSTEVTALPPLFYLLEHKICSCLTL
jgi:hypothetical protein